MKLFNTLTKKKETLKVKKTVTMYNCGLTVYDYAHIGNLRAYTFADLLRRYLEWKGLKVKQVMNFTDVGHMVGETETGKDKMEAGAKRDGKTPEELAKFYIKAFLEDSKKMRFLEPYKRPKATDHIKEMILLIQKLIKNGKAYESNGSVYYSVSKFKNYGKLSGNTLEHLKEGAGGRVKCNPDKKNQFDFALWVNDSKHLMKWKSPWSVGYPGWHLECSVMAQKYLGDTIDIHTGGEDNIFPHHECEIAQTEGVTGKKFVKYWLHVRHLMVDNRKMSKSLGNFYTLRDLEKKGYDPIAVRYILLASHYRTQMNFTLEGLKNTEATLKGLRDFLARLKEAKGKDNKDVKKLISEAKKGFEEAMDDDLNTPEVFATLFDLVNKVNRLMNKGKLSKKNANDVIKFFMDVDRVLGLLKYEAESVPKEIKKLADQREKARKKKDFSEADKIRKKMVEKGWIVEDKADGYRLRKK